MLNSTQLYCLAQLNQAERLAEAEQFRLTRLATASRRSLTPAPLLKMAALVLTVLALAWQWVPAAQANNYTVSCEPPQTSRLIGAINLANANPGPDEITLAPDCVYSFAAPLSSSGFTALPVIAGDLTINGNGAIIERTANATQAFRLLVTNYSSNLTAHDLAIRNGVSSHGTAISAEGNLTMTHVVVISNTASMHGAVYVNGSAVISNSHFERNSNGALYVLGDLTIAGNTVFLDNTNTSVDRPNGGAVAAYKNVTIRNSLFERNRNLIGNGGGLYAVSGFDVLIENSTFKFNEAAGSGGGLYAISNALGGYRVRLENGSVFESNKASGGNGGGIYVAGSLEVENASFKLNEAAASGGGAYVELGNGSTLRLANSTFNANKALGTIPNAGYGGGLYITGPGADALDRVQISDTAFLGNNAKLSGGALYTPGHATINNSTFAGNLVFDGYGGGLYVNRSLQLQRSYLSNNYCEVQGCGLYLGHRASAASETSLLANNVWHGNSASNGGALGHTMVLGDVSSPGPIRVYHNTIVGNYPGGIGVYGGYGNIDFQNNIVTRFKQGLGRAGGTFGANYNLFYQNETHYASLTTVGPNNLLSIDPYFFNDNGDFRLFFGSPAIDAGTNVGVTVDRTGAARPADGNNDGSAGFDIGAYEYGSVAGPGNNQSPLAVDDPNYTTQSGTPLTVSPGQGVLANDSDPDGNPLQAILQNVLVIDAGQLTLNEDGSFTYEPASGFSGDYRFTYVARDGQANSNPAMVTVRVGAGSNGGSAAPLFLPFILK